MWNNKIVTIFFIIFGLLGTLLFIFIGYVISGALFISENQDMNFWQGFMYVLSDPFYNYFNDYSIFLMIAGFLTFEIIYFFVYISLSSGRGNITDSDLVDDTDLAYQDSADEMSDKDLFNGYLSGSSLSDSGSGSKGVIDGLSPDSFSSFDDSIMNTLFDNGYELDQIIAMLPIKNYIPDVSADVLMMMFDNTLPKEEITASINSFYSKE